jgi:hypothetical protein
MFPRGWFGNPHRRRLGIGPSGDPPYSSPCIQSAIEGRLEDDDEEEEKDGYAQEESLVDS